MSKRKTFNSVNPQPRKKARMSIKTEKKEAEQLKIGFIHKQELNENEFGHAWFSLCLVLENQQGVVVHDHDELIPIKVSLFFENGEEPSSNLLQTDPKHLLIKDGSCQFRVFIDTISQYHHNRKFKFVFSQTGYKTRHIQDFTTPAFKLVKHRLDIEKQPAEKFYKDEGGRSNCLTCDLVLKDSKDQIVDRRVPLTAKLIYDDLSPAQSQRDILEIITQKLELIKGKIGIHFRINEVSKNHNKRAFRILIEAAQMEDTTCNDISSCITRNIMVYSKRTKLKGEKSKSHSSHAKRPLRSKANQDEETETDSEQFEPKHTADHKMRWGGLPQFPPLHTERKQVNGLGEGTAKPERRGGEEGQGGGLLSTMFEWCELSQSMMRTLEWTRVGYEYDEESGQIDSKRPLFRCPYCLRYRNISGNGDHDPHCQLDLLLHQYETKVKALSMEWNFQCNNEPAAGGTSMGVISEDLEQREQQEMPNSSSSALSRRWGVPEPMGRMMGVPGEGGERNGHKEFESVKEEKRDGGDNSLFLDDVVNVCKQVSTHKDVEGYPCYNADNKLTGFLTMEKSFVSVNTMEDIDPNLFNAPLSDNEFLARPFGFDSADYFEHLERNLF